MTPFDRACPGLAGPGARNAMAIEAGSGLVESVYVEVHPQRGRVAFKILTLLLPGAPARTAVKLGG